MCCVLLPSDFTERRMVKRVGTGANGASAMQIGFGHTYAGGKVGSTVPPLAVHVTPPQSLTGSAPRAWCRAGPFTPRYLAPVPDPATPTPVLRRRAPLRKRVDALVWPPPTPCWRARYGPSAFNFGAPSCAGLVCARDATMPTRHHSAKALSHLLHSPAAHAWAVTVRAHTRLCVLCACQCVWGGGLHI
jgi:hypothetical protein